MAIAFYCLGTLDAKGSQISPTDRKSWKEWIWDQYVGNYPSFFSVSQNRRIWGALFFFLCSPLVLVCAIIEGSFYPGPFVNVSGRDTAHVRLFPHSNPPLCVRLLRGSNTN
jgi:hypothetical protein